jgi:hypothetical protein
MATDGNGRYHIDNVLPGNYVLVFRLPGYSPAIRDIEIGAGGPVFQYDVQLSPLRQPPAPASGTVVAPPHVVCGMTMIAPQRDVDPGIRAPVKRPPGAQPVKPTIRAVQPSVCWDKSADSPPKPKR